MSSSNKSSTKSSGKKAFKPRVFIPGVKYCDSCNYVNTEIARKCLLCGAEFSGSHSSSANDHDFSPSSSTSASGNTQTGSGSERSFKVTLNNPGDRKLEVIKAIREIKKCDLRLAKKIVSSYPHVVIDYVTREEAVKAAGILRSLGANVAIE